MEDGSKSDLHFLRPRTGLELLLIISVVIVFALWVYRHFHSSANIDSSKAAIETRRDAYALPERIDYDLVRIHRTAEDETAAEISRRWLARGRPENLAAVYELSMIPYKPIFFLSVARKGGIDRQKLLEEEIHHFDGSMAAFDKVTEIHRDETAFLCASFQRGTGMAALSAICVWDDVASAGFGVRLAGGDVQDTLRYTSEARRRCKSQAPRPPFPFAEDEPLITPRDESELNRSIRDIVASLSSYNCQRFKRYLTPGSEQMFRDHVDQNVLVSIKDPVEKVCFVLSILKFPRSETMMIRQREGKRADQVILQLSGDGAQNGPIQFFLVKIADGWKIDPEWALKQVQDYPVRMSLLQFAMNQQGRSSYSDAPMSRNSEQGIANQNSATGKIYMAFSAQRKSICGSAISESGELFMIQLDPAKRVTYLKGASLPSECPASPLQKSW